MCGCVDAEVLYQFVFIITYSHFLVPITNVKENYEMTVIDNSEQEKDYTSSFAIELISDKWAVEVLHAIKSGYNRYSSMKRFIPDISGKMLTQTLRKLERSGIIERIDFQEKPPRVEYMTTSIGTSLVNILTLMCQWSKKHNQDVSVARKWYDDNREGWI